MDQITHEMRLAHWKSIISKCHARPEGQTARQWLAQQGINEKQYYYWQRRIRKEAHDQLAGLLPADTNTSGLMFAEIPLTGSIAPAEPSPFRPDVVIRSSKVTIELSNSVSEQLLNRILGGFANAQ